MRALVQRVSEASVNSANERGEPPEVTGRIGPGLVVFVGVTHHDDAAVAVKLADKLWNLRIFPDADGAMNASCAEVGGDVLVVSQFTLYGDARKGRRPSYIAAARPEQAEPLVDAVVTRLREHGAQFGTGRFRTHMEVALVNDGPVTLLLEV